MIEIYTEPKGKIYEKLIEYAMQTTDAFMFVCCNYYNSKQYAQKAAKMRKQLAPLSIKRRHNPKWPGTIINSDKYNYNICFYHSHSMAVPVLKEPGHSFGWIYPDFPEDLAFFRKGSCWMTTVAHEEMLWFTNETKEDVEFLKSLGLMETAGYFPEFNEPFIEEGL